MKDLFGKEIIELDFVKAIGPYQKFKKLNDYRKTESKDYCCKTCLYRITHEMNKTYFKCELMGESASSASDIRLSCVCKKWELEKIGKL